MFYETYKEESAPNGLRLRTQRRDPIAAVVVKKSAYWIFALVLAAPDANTPHRCIVDAPAIFTVITYQAGSLTAEFLPERSSA
jgi:hypothetical protein